MGRVSRGGKGGAYEGDKWRRKNGRRGEEKRDGEEEKEDKE